MLELDGDKIKDPAKRESIRQLIEFAYFLLDRPGSGIKSFSGETTKHFIFLACMPVAFVLLSKSHLEASYQEIFESAAANAERLNSFFIEILIDRVTEGMPKN